MRRPQPRTGAPGAFFGVVLGALTGCAGAPSHGADSGHPATARTTGHPVSVYSHCGIRSASFDGRTWVADRTIPEPRRRPGPGGAVSYTGYTTGTFTLTARNTAVFVVDTRTFVHDGSPIVFHPAGKTPVPCQ